MRRLARIVAALGLALASGCGSSAGGGSGAGGIGSEGDEGGEGLAPPVAALAAPRVASPGVPVSVSALASTGEITRYRFDFGDGSEPRTTSEPFVLHRFRGNGAVRVSVTVEGPGGSDVAETRVNVAPGIAGTSRFDLPRAREIPGWQEVPFPSDLLIDPATGRVALSGLTFGSPLARRVLETGVNALPGFGCASGIFVWTDAELARASFPADEAASVAPGASVFVMNVDPASPEYRRRAPVDVRFDAGERRLSVLPVAGEPLRPDTRYALVVRTDVFGPDGNLTAPPSLGAVLAGRAEGATGARANALYRALTGALAGEPDFPDGDLSGIAAATVFTTQPVTDDGLAIRAAMDRGDPSIPEARPSFDARWVYGRGGARGLDELLGEQPRRGFGLNPRAHESISTIVTRGTLPAPSYLSRDPTFLDPYGGSFERGDDGPRVQRIVELPFTLVLPTGPVPDDGYPVVIAQHGLGGNRADVVAISNELASIGFAVIGIDAVQHGQRYDASNVAPIIFEVAVPILEAFGIELPERWEDEGPNFRGTLDAPDGFADSNPVGPVIAFFEAFLNIGALRDNFRQSAIDLLQLTRMVRGPDLRVPGVGRVALDGERIYLMGWSLGGIIGTGYAAYAPEVRGVVLNSTGGGIATRLLTGSPSLAGQLGPVATIAFGIPSSALADPFDPFIALSQTILEQADPIHLARHLIREPLALGGMPAEPRSVLFAMAMWDEIVPNSANEALARALGLQLLEPSYRPVPGVPSGGARLDGNVRGVSAGLAQYAPAEHFAFHFRRRGEVYYRVGFPFEGAAPFPLADDPPFEIRLPIDPALTQVLDFLRGELRDAPGRIEMKMGYRPRADHDDDGVLDDDERAAGTDPSDPTSRP